MDIADGGLGFVSFSENPSGCVGVPPSTRETSALDLRMPQNANKCHRLSCADQQPRFQHET